MGRRCIVAPPARCRGSLGGLAFSQLVTLYVTPVFDTYFDELQTRFMRSGAHAHAPEAEGGSMGVPLPAPAGD